MLSLTGKIDPQTGLEGKFSIYHCIAVGLIQGAAGEKQFADAVVRDPVVVGVRKRVTVRTDPAVKSERCDLTVRLKDGRVLTRHIENAVGSLEKPMSDAALDAKFADLAEGVLPRDRARRLMEMCRGVEGLKDAGAIGVAGGAV